MEKDNSSIDRLMPKDAISEVILLEKVSTRKLLTNMPMFVKMTARAMMMESSLIVSPVSPGWENQYLNSADR